MVDPCEFLYTSLLTGLGLPRNPSGLKVGIELDNPVWFLLLMSESFHGGIKYTEIH